MKAIGVIVIVITLIGMIACSTTTIINTTTVVPTSTVTVSNNSSTVTLTTTHIGQLNAANSEVAAVLTANQAYAAENGGKFAPNSNKLLQYLTSLPDAIYFFNENTGSITSAVNGTGITKNLQWDSTTQRWK
jgi:hypothetical protein